MDVNGRRCEHGAVGALLCILSAAGFGAMAIFGKLALDEGVGVGDLLLVPVSYTHLTLPTILLV